MSLYEIQVTDIRGNDTDLSAYRGRPMLIVNTATKCGFAPQFKGLQRLHEQYADQGLAVLGFPSNQFANQEPGNNEEILQACELNHGVTFPLFAKIDVKGPTAHPLFQQLTKDAPGFLGTKRIKWNFTKFLIDKSGRVVKRFSPTVAPEKIDAWVRKLL